MFDRNLVPTDGSETAAAAIDRAIAFAERDVAEHHVIHVIDTGTDDTGIESGVAPRRERGQAYADRLVDAGLWPRRRSNSGAPTAPSSSTTTTTSTSSSW